MNINKQKLKSILKECLVDALQIIKEQKKKDEERDWKWTFDHHENFPTMSFFDSGLPSFYLNSYHKIDYSKFLTKDKRHLEIESWKKYYDYVVENEDLRKYFGLMEFSPLNKNAKEESFIFYNQIYTYYFLANFVDTYIHLDSLEFTKSVFDSQFEKYYLSIITKRLEITIAIPILFMVFDFDELEIDNRISIKRIEKPIQLARNTRKNYTSSAHDVVIGAATHAFYIKNWFIDNDSQTQRDNSLTEINSFKEPIVLIENLFGTLRLILNVETGYYQILSIPKDWKYNGKAELPEIFVTSEKKYPEKFENYGWHNSISLISKTELSNFKEIYSKLSSNQFSLAIKRLNSAFIRKNDEDSIIDITIAFESLLTNDSNSEITYRLSTRVAQLCKLEKFKNYSTKQVFEFCKKIYNFRSAVVHGDMKRIEKTRKIELEQSKEIKIIEISVELLKHLIKVMIDKDIIGTKQIDELML
ncbi:hypothetical protein ACW5R3_12310 [Bizionia sp. KMM 8389]